MLNFNPFSKFPIHYNERNWYGRFSKWENCQKYGDNANGNMLKTRKRSIFYLSVTIFKVQLLNFVSDFDLADCGTLVVFVSMHHFWSRSIETMKEFRLFRQNGIILKQKGVNIFFQFSVQFPLWTFHFPIWILVRIALMIVSKFSDQEKYSAANFCHEMIGL